MGIASFSGASSVIKPGVVTSSTRPSSPFVGQLIFETDTNRLAAYNGSAWVTQNGGLVRVGGGALSGSSTTFSSVFSANYHAYAIVGTNLSASAASSLNMTLGATTTGYYYTSIAAFYSTSNYTAQIGAENAASWNFLGNLNSATGGFLMQIENPFLSAITTFTAPYRNGIGSSGSVTGLLNNTTSYTAFTIAPASGTLTGTVNIYGYALS